MPKDKHEPKHEIEVKLRGGDRAELLRRLRQLGARPLGCRMHEMNALYDTPRRDLLLGGQALGVRILPPAPPRGGTPALARRAPTKIPRERRSRGAGSTEQVTLTYKGPARSARGKAPAAAGAARYKIRTEDELRVPAAPPLGALLRASGPPAFVPLREVPPGLPPAGFAGASRRPRRNAHRRFRRAGGIARRHRPGRGPAGLRPGRLHH